MALPCSVQNYVDLHERVNRDNYTLRHFAEDPDANVRSTMFLTPFVYQYFIYNSLFQVDWRASIESDTLKYHPGRYDPAKQKKFEEFLQSASSSHPGSLSQAFADIEALEIAGPWTRIIPDALITQEQGTKFFNDLRSFQRSLRALRRSPDAARLPDVFECIGELRPFVYKVRCNIFHGRKSLAEAVEPEQNMRIQLYYQLLRGIVILFFLVVDEYVPPQSSPESSRPTAW